MKYIRAFCLGIVLIMILLRVATWALVNQGSLYLVRGIMRSGASLGEYPHWMIKSQPVLIQQAQRAFELANQIDPFNVTARWGYGRAALAAGRADKATSVLLVDAPRPSTNPIRYLDLLMAYSRTGDGTAVLTLFAKKPALIARPTISDTIALAYLSKARSVIEINDWEEALSALRQAVSFRPVDLYANYYLWRNAVLTGNSEDAAVYHERLVYFPVEAVRVNDERFLDYAWQVFPELLSDDVWGHERGHNLVGYWVWQYPDSPALGSLLQSLTERFPNEAEWHLYRGERYHRLGQFELAEREYQQASSTEACYIHAHERLTQLILEKSSFGHPAAAEVMQQDQETTAQLLGVPYDTVRLGANLIQGDTFVTVTQGTPVGWFYGKAAGKNNWQFATGSDALEREGGVRIANLWWPMVDNDSGYIPYAEYRGSAVTIPTAWLMVSMWYKLEGNPSDTGLMFVGSNTSDFKPFVAHILLPETSGRWVKLMVVGSTPELRSNLFLGMRNWGAANVWFQDVAMRSVNLSAAPSRCSETPCVFFSPSMGQ
jgi:tetratricopeptide (TPR) repeat protein